MTDDQKRIVSALRCCGDADHDFDCEHCPLPEDGEECRKLVTLAAALIERMAAEDERNVSENNELRKTIGIMEQNYTAMKRERDAAVRDMNWFVKCDVCAIKSDSPECQSHEHCIFRWRGLCKENRASNDDEKGESNDG